MCVLRELEVRAAFLRFGSVTCSTIERVRRTRGGNSLVVVLVSS